MVVTPLADSEAVLTANFEISCDHYFGFLDLVSFRELSPFPHARSVSASKMITVACVNYHFPVLFLLAASSFRFSRSVGIFLAAAFDLNILNYNYPI